MVLGFFAANLARGDLKDKGSWSGNWLTTSPASRKADFSFRVYVHCSDPNVKSAAITDLRYQATRDAAPKFSSNTIYRTVSAPSGRTRGALRRQVTVDATTTTDNAAAAPTLHRQKTVDPSHTDLPPSGESIKFAALKEQPLNLQEVSECCWWTQVDLPGDDSLLWSSETPNPTFFTKGTLSCTVILRTADDKETRFNASFVLQDDDAGSRVLFVSRSPDLKVAYRDLIKAIWSHSSSIDAALSLKMTKKAQKELNQARVYEILWEHGLLLIFLRKWSEEVKEEFSKQDGIDLLGKLAPEIVSTWTAENLLQLWGTIGTLLLMNPGKTTQTTLDAFLKHTYLAPSKEASAVLKEWSKAKRNDEQAFAEGAHHLKHFANKAINFTFQGEISNAMKENSVCTYRHLREVPLMLDLRLLNREDDAVPKIQPPRSRDLGELARKSRELMNHLGDSGGIKEMKRLPGVRFPRDRGTQPSSLQDACRDIMKFRSTCVPILDTELNRFEELLKKLRGAISTFALDKHKMTRSSLESARLKLSDARRLFQTASLLEGREEVLREQIVKVNNLKEQHQIAEDVQKVADQFQISDDASPSSVEYRLRVEAGNGRCDDKSGKGKGYNSMKSPWGVCSLNDGRFVVSDRDCHKIKVEDPQGLVDLVGQDKPGLDVGPFSNTKLNHPKGMCILPDGSLLVADCDNHRIIKVDFKSRETSVFAGSANGESGFQNGAGGKARFDSPSDVAFCAKTGCVIVADEGNHLLRQLKFKKKVTVTTVAGQAKTVGSVDGSCKKALLCRPLSVTCRPDGSIVFCQGGSLKCIREVVHGEVKTLVGDPEKSGDKDGQLSEALLESPAGVVSCDTEGSILVSDLVSHKIKLLAGGVIVTVAGSGNAKTEDGIGLRGAINGPRLMSMRNDGTVLIAEGLGYRVRSLVTPLAIEGARRLFDDARAPVRKAQSELRQSSRQFHQDVHAAISTAAATEEALFDLYTISHSASYMRESHCALLEMNATTRREYLRTLIISSPRLRDLEVLVGQLIARFDLLGDPDLLELCSRAIRIRIQKYTWPDIAETREDFQFLTQLVLKSGGLLVGWEVICSIFQSRDLKISVDQWSLALLEATRIGLPNVPDAARAQQELGNSIHAWLTQVVPVASWTKPLPNSKKGRRGHEFGMGMHQQPMPMMHQDLDLEAFLESSGIEGLDHGGINVQMALFNKYALLGEPLTRPFSDVFKDLANWWVKKIETIVTSNDSDKNIDTLSWLINIHLRGQAQMNSSEIIGTIPNAEVICIHPLITDAYNRAVCEVAERLSSDEVFSQLVRIHSNSKKSTSSLVYNAMYSTMSSLCASFESSSSNHQLSFSHILQETRSSNTLVSFFNWTRQQEKRIDAATLSSPQWKALSEIVLKIEAALLTMEQCAQSSAIEVHDVKESLATSFVPCLKTASGILKMDHLVPLLEQLGKDVDNAFNTLQRMLVAAKTFFEDSPIPNALIEVEQKWRRLRCYQVRYFNDLTCQDFPLEQIIPREYLSSFEWLYNLRDSELFKLVWNDAQGPNTLEKIQTVRNLWGVLSLSMKTRDLSLDQMSKLMHLLIKREELDYLARGVSVHGSAESSSWVGDVHKEVEKWHHIQSVRDRLDNIEACLPLMKPMLKETKVAKASFEKLSSHLSSIKETFQLCQWSSLTMQKYDLFAKDASNIHLLIPNLDADLLQAMQDCSDICDWLRENPDDADFSSGLQIARGKSEMQCPLELWVLGEGGGPGHLDEGKLSMLDNVRRTLHPFLFREDKQFSTIDSTIETLAKIEGSTAKTVADIRMCHKFHLPLMDLLGDDYGAPDRLMGIMEESRKATWISTNEKGGSTQDDCLFLEFSEEREIEGTKQRVMRRLNMAELLDFQSTVVLSKSSNRTFNASAAIQEYIEQFGWMQQLTESLCKLENAGHFHYHAFTHSFPMSDSTDPIKQQHQELEKTLEEWNSAVQAMREKPENHVVNFFSMQQLHQLLRWLVDPSLQNSIEVPRELLHEVYPSIDDEAVVEKFASVLRPHSFVKPKSDVEALSVCIEQLVIAATSVERPENYPRKIEIPGIGDHRVGANIYDQGVHVITTQRPSLVYDVVLSAYARAGMLPEKEFLLVCDAHTQWEDVQNLLLRWTSGYCTLYCLAFVELLGFEVQQKTVAFLRQLKEYKNALLILSGTQESVHLVAQHSHWRCTYFPLPAEIITSISEEMSSKYSQGISAYSSGYAGAGKSFLIRHRAAAEYSAEYVRVSFVNSDNVAIRLKKAMAEITKPTVLHIDLAHTVGGDFDSIMFELVFLRGYVDPKTHEAFKWNPALVAICFEIASGPELTKLHFWTLLPQEIVVAQAESFVADRENLMIGMGDDFASSRHDGTTINGQAVTERDAYERLQYVCSSLRILDEKHGSFPFAMPDKYARPIIEGPEAFKLLIEVTKLANRPSLWCIWNFVNLLYLQLVEFHKEDSVLNRCFLPDPQSEFGEFDVANKEALKGAMIGFMIKTAFQFATRQIRPSDKEPISGIMVGGLSWSTFNGRFIRTPYSVDGKPCFQKRLGSRSYYIYYRSAHKQWVLNDSIEPQGPIFCTTTAGIGNIKEGWTSPTQWEPAPSITVQQIKDPKGFNGEAILIQGCNKLKDEGVGAIGSAEDGVYLRQPPHDPVEVESGKPHYVKLEPVRRHLLFHKPQSGMNGPYWGITPVCNFNHGLFAQTETDDLFGSWKIKPPDRQETNATITIVRGTLGKGINRDETDDREGFFEPQDEEVDAEEDLLQLSDLMGWNESNHESLLFSNTNNIVRFLSLDPSKMRESMRPDLKALLEAGKINIGEDLDKLTDTHYDVLSSLTEKLRTPEEGKNLLPGYCLTGDNLLKMLAILGRVRCGVPVVLMGECGCGKTELLRYLAKWIEADLKILDIHGGTEEAEILKVFQEAEDAVAMKDEGQVFVFLDEINTCGHMGLISEIICQHSMYGSPISNQIVVLAALNPYRVRANGQQTTAGLVYNLHQDAEKDPMSDLVYRVHSIPLRLKDFIFDFGTLSESRKVSSSVGSASSRNSEETYIEAMVKSSFTEPKILSVDLEQLVKLIVTSQRLIRENEGDISSASLRDVRRCLNLIHWFSQDKFFCEFEGVSSFVVSAILGLAFVYFFRLPSRDARSKYWNQLASTVAKSTSGFFQFRTHSHNNSRQRDNLPKHLKRYVDVLQEIQSRVASTFEVEEGIALNQALSENLFVTTVCMLNKIPIFIVGKPGSSKTLTMQVIASNLQGKQSLREHWRKYPAVHVFSYQCSPMSDSGSIQYQFGMASRFQADATDTIAVLLLDEVGLAEHSPEMPLKVLHGMLIDPPVAIVGLSNWVLDPAKMNRAVCLQRPEPSPEEIESTGHSIVKPGETSEPVETSHLNEYLPQLAKAYHTVYTNQEGRDFIGLRDYYNLIKLVRRELKASKSGILTPQMLMYCVSRNFGGKPDMVTRIASVFLSTAFPECEAVEPVSTQKLIADNLSDVASRHIMILTSHGAALPLLFNMGMDNFKEEDVSVLIGSRFKDDLSELQLVKQINEVKEGMAKGSAVVLLNHDNIYEALYDVLNQRYVTRIENTGKAKKMLRLAIGSRSQLCDVMPGFKMVVIVEQLHAYDNLDLPLLNRFEKQILLPKDLINQNQAVAVTELSNWVATIGEEAQLLPSDIFCGFHDGSIPTLVLYRTGCGYKDKVSKALVDQMKRDLANVAFPTASYSSSSLGAANEKDYFITHMDLESVVHHQLLPEKNAMLVLFTQSPVSHAHPSIVALREKEIAHVDVLHLAELSSEKNLTQQYACFFNRTETPRILMVQTDPFECSQALIDHSRRICVQQKHAANSPEHCHVIFLIHLPPSVDHRVRHFSLDFHQPWNYCFLDDVRPMQATESDVAALDTKILLENSAFQLAEQKYLHIEKTVQQLFQSALSACSIPHLTDEHLLMMNSHAHRIQLIQKHLQNPRFKDLLCSLVYKVLEAHKEADSKCSLHLHAKMARELSAGSLRQSLNLALELLVVQSLVHAFCTLDENFNMMLVDTYTELWLDLAYCEAVLNQSAVAGISKPGSVSLTSTRQVVNNSGKNESLVSQFPFSSKIIAILNASDTREIAENSGNVGSEEWLKRQSQTLFTAKVCDNWGTLGREYLHDFVAIAAPKFPDLSESLQYAIYLIVCKSWKENVLESPASIHTTIWACENQLFHISSVMAISSIPTWIKNSIIDALERQVAEAVPGPQNLELIDRTILRIALDGFWRMCEDGVTEITSWLNMIAEVQRDIQALFVLAENGPKNEDFETLQKQWRSLRVARAYGEVINLGKDEEGFAQLMSLRDVMLTEEVASRGMMVSLFCIAAKVHKEELATDFILRYLKEVVFGEVGEHLENLIPDFVEFLITILNREVTDPLLTYLNTAVSLQRVIVRCLWPLFDDNDWLRAPQAAQLYLQHEYDQILFEQIGRNDVTTAQRNLIKESDLMHPETIRAIASLHVAINYEGNVICTCVEKKLESRILTRMMSTSLKKVLKTSERGRCLMLKCFKSIGNKDLLLEVLRLPKNLLPWLEADRTNLKNLAEQAIADPLPWLDGEEKYSNLTTAVRATLRGKQKPALVEDIVKRDNISPELLVGTAWNQLSNGPYDKSHLDEFSIWLNVWSDKQGSEQNQSIRNIITWITKGAELSAFPTGLDPKKENMVNHSSMWALFTAMKCMTPNSWQYSLLFDAGKQKKSLMPSMIDSELHIQYRINIRRGGAAFYLCPNNHMYIITDCTYPYTTGICPTEGCNATIGGRDHKAHPGNRRIGAEEVEEALDDSVTFGYHDTGGLGSDGIERITPFSTRILRFYLHSLLRVGLAVGDTAQRNAIATLISPNKDSPIDDRKAANMICSYLVEDWDQLKQHTSLGDSDVMLFVFKIFYKMRDLEIPAAFTTLQKRNEWELKFQKECVTPFMVSVKKTVEDVEVDLKCTGDTALVTQALGEDLWNSIHEVDTTPTVDNLLFRFRKPVELAQFQTAFAQIADGQAMYPFLSTFLNLEETLPVLKYGADILAWHGIIFEVLKPYKYTREELVNKTNLDIIKMLPGAKQAAAKEIFERFQTGFTEILPLIENFTCDAENPFRERDPDVEGYKLNFEMDLDTSILYSIPWKHADPRELDAMMYCTITILRFVHEQHNNLLDSLQKVRGGIDKTTTAGNVIFPALLKTNMNWKTPYDIVKRSLIDYDREAHLQPVLCTFSDQKLDMGEGWEIRYDFERIEKALCHHLLAQAMPLSIEVAELRLSTDFKATKRIDALRLKIDQEPVPVAVKEALAEEITTKDHLMRLQFQLEECILFLGSMGGATVKIDGRLKLEDYVLNTLSLPADRWMDTTTPTISQQVLLCHLDDLYSQLFDDSENIREMYKIPIPGPLESELRKVLPKLNLEGCITCLKEVINGQLGKDNVQPPPADFQLKEYMSYLDDEVVEHIPEQLELQHAAAVMSIWKAANK